MRFAAAAVALLVVAQPLAAQDPVPDSLRRRAPAKPIIRVWEAGIVVGLTAGAMAIDQSLRNSVQAHRSGFKDDLSNFGNAFGEKYYVYPGLVVSTLAGRVFHSKTLERVSWHALESTVLAGGVALVLKSAIGRRRPDVIPHDAFNFGPFTFKDNSFPSGHTTVAFALATSLAGETKDHWSDVLFYSLATLTGFSRVNDDKHWLADTVFGAAVGIVSARLVQRRNRPFLVGPGLVAASFSF